MARKQDYPPLLADGLHPRTIEEVQALSVDAFPLSTSRARLMAGLRAMVDLLTADGIQGDLWVDGSFLTGKIDPEDIDVVLELSLATANGATPDQADRLRWLTSQADADVAQKRNDYACDCYAFLEVPGIPSNRGYWLRQFGRDRSNTPKGIVVLQINGGVR